MSIRQVMEFTDELIKNGQLPGNPQKEEESLPKDQEDQTSKEDKKPKKSFLQKFFDKSPKKKEASLKVKIMIPEQELDLSQDDFVKFAKMILEVDMKINKTEIVKIDGGVEHADN